MAYCTNCGKKLSDDAKFCSECGTPVGSTSSARKITYEGEIRKCPQCGEVINAFVSVCPSCGHEMRGATATSVVHQLALKLDTASSVSEKEKLIRNFYIPNTLEDILECLILASSNIETNSDCRNAWEAKLEQIYQKAQLTFGNSAEFEYVEEKYTRTLRRLRLHKSVSMTKSIAGGLLHVIGGFFHGMGTVLRGLWELLSLLLRCIGKIFAFLGNILASLLTPGALKTIGVAICIVGVALCIAIMYLAYLYN